MSGTTPQRSRQRPTSPLGDLHRKSHTNTSPGSKVAHTLTACCRCRHRKTRCDAGLPRCGPCARSKEECEYFDTTKGRKISRKYVIHLQDKVRALERELAAVSSDRETFPDAELMVRGAGLVRFKQNDESRFLGPSSGIAITRLIMEFAKHNCGTKNIKEIVPEIMAQQIKDRSTKESSKPTSKIYPVISDVAAPDLPTPELVERLVDNFNKKAQYMLPVLHEPSFKQAVIDVYNGSNDAYKNFTLRMVVAISMQKLNVMWAGLADSYYLAALPYLEDAVRPMDLGTLQCFALMAQYSLVTPTRTASYWVVGLATRLCQDLGLTDEATIARDDSGKLYTPLEVDLRRRLFWIITSMEFGLAHSLGRPSAFGTSYDHINIGFFAEVDDQYIDSNGVMLGSPRSMKKRIAIHFFRMRLLQAEIRRQLYLKKRSTPKDDRDPWFIQMERKLEDWLSASPLNDEGSGLSPTWFKGRYNTMIVFLFRPCPQVPQPSLRAAEQCFEASRFNIDMQWEQIRTRSIDLTWIFTQSLFMALNTILWTLSYPEIRKEHPRVGVEACLGTAQEAIRAASEKWPGVDSALALYESLIQACLKAYDQNSEFSYSVDSPSNKFSPTSTQDMSSPPSLATPPTIHGLLSMKQAAPGSDQTTQFSHSYDQQAQIGDYNSFVRPGLVPTESQGSTSVQDYASAPATSTLQSSLSFPETSFDPTSPYNPLPSPLVFTQELFTSQGPLSMPYQDQNFYLGSIGDQYSQYLHSQYLPQQPLDSLDQEQQIELMNRLESDGWSDIGLPLDQSAIIFPGGDYGGR